MTDFANETKGMYWHLRNADKPAWVARLYPNVIRRVCPDGLLHAWNPEVPWREMHEIEVVWGPDV